MYLNESIADGQTRVDEEVVYAGLHDRDKNRNKFKRTKKYSSRHTKARG